MSAPLTVHNAQITTAAVEVKTLTLPGAAEHRLWCPLPLPQATGPPATMPHRQPHLVAQRRRRPACPVRRRLLHRLPARPRPAPARHHPPRGRNVMARYNVRDMIGHFVKPRRAEGRMCPHACCRGHRVHPDNYPVILPSRLLRRASDYDLAEHFDRVSTGTTPQDRWALSVYGGPADIGSAVGMSGVRPGR
jgi:hypothetical protein